MALLYLGVPVLAAVLISQRGGKRYIEQSADDMQRWLRYVAAFFSYLLLLSDKITPGEAGSMVRFEVRASGEPTVGGVLVRIILAIPHAIVLGLLSVVAFFLVVIAAVMILIQESYPAGIFSFLRGYMRWNARLYAYMAGLLQEYPPFAFDTEAETPALPPGRTA